MSESRSNPATIGATTRWLALAELILHMGAIGMAFGILVPLTALLLEQRGLASSAIGFVSAMPSLGIVIAMPLAPRLVARFGVMPMVLSGLSISLVSVLLMPVADHPVLWALLRLVAGMAMAVPWLLGETWINALAPEARRGQIMALYGMAFFGGMAVGPLVLQAAGTEGWLPFLLAASGILIAAAPLPFIGHLAPNLKAKQAMGLIGALVAAPTVFGTALMGGISESALYTLLPVYGVRSGMAEGEALQLLTWLLVGAIVLQYPMGMLSDLIGRRLILILLALLAVVCCLAILALPTGNTLSHYILMVPLGGCLLAFYALGLALLGQRFLPVQLAVANATFILTYELGSLSGPVLAGLAMDLGHPGGLLGFIAAVCGIFASIALWRGRVRRPVVDKDYPGDPQA